MGSALEALGAKVKAGDDADKAKLSAELRNMADALKGRGPCTEFRNITWFCSG